jgi:5-methylcytosine-specific restriction endonuclease McrA
MYLSTSTTATVVQISPRATTFWRTRTAPEFSEADITVIADELRRIVIFDERWPLARQGNVPEAVVMMVAEWPVSSVSRRIDALMSAVTIAALAGSAAAALVIYHTMAQLALHLPEFEALVASWSAVDSQHEASGIFRRCVPPEQPPKATASPDLTAGGPKINYRKYLSSSDWRSNPVRLREFETSGFQCRLCPNSVAQGHALEAHHRTYERLGCEADGDLTALCPNCHVGVTSMLRARRYAASPPAASDYVPVIAEPEPLFDPFTIGVKK